MKLLSTCLMVTLLTQVHAQNVGVGTTTPSKLLSVKGSLLVDQNNENNASLDSAALRFGTATGVGIASNRTVLSSNQHGLDFYTNNLRRLSISSNGNVGIGDISPGYKLDVNGLLRAPGSIIGDASLTIAGSINGYSAANFYNNLYVADYLGVGATPTSSYRVRIGGNALVETNLGVDGNLRTDGNFTLGGNQTVAGTSNISGKLTNEGKAIMLSNSSTTLRSGFTSGTFSIALNPGQLTDITFITPTFTGNNGNIRVMVAQFQPGTSASNWGGVIMTPHSIDPSDANYGNQSTVKIRFQNTSATLANLGSNAVLYLYVVVTH